MCLLLWIFSSHWLLLNSQVKLAEFSKTPEDFLRKYEDLKSKNVRNLDPLVYLLSKLCEDKEVRNLLQAFIRFGLLTLGNHLYFTHYVKIHQMQCAHCFHTKLSQLSYYTSTTCNLSRFFPIKIP